MCLVTGVKSATAAADVSPRVNGRHTKEADMTTTSSPASTPQQTDADTPVMGLLEEHVPLSLIMDLIEPAGPDSADILQTEGQPDGTWWVQP